MCPARVFAERGRRADVQAGRVQIAARRRGRGSPTRSAGGSSRRTGSGRRGFAQRAVAHDVAADDRAVAVAVAGDQHREDRVRGPPGLVAAISLPDAPAVVGARARARGREVDLLLQILSDVADDQRAGRAVEGEAPGVAQPVGPDLRLPAGLPGERVAARDRVAAARATGRSAGSCRAACRCSGRCLPGRPRCRRRRRRCTGRLPGPNASWPPLWLVLRW